MTELALSQEVQTEYGDTQQDKEEPSIGREVELFLEHLDALETSLPLVMGMVELAHKKSHDKYSEYLQEHGRLDREDEKGKGYILQSENFVEADKLERRIKSLKISRSMIPNSFIVGSGT